jgi:hypothetical protein
LNPRPSVPQKHCRYYSCLESRTYILVSRWNCGYLGSFGQLCVRFVYELHQSRALRNSSRRSGCNHFESHILGTPPIFFRSQQSFRPPRTLGFDDRISCIRCTKLSFGPCLRLLQQFPAPKSYHLQRKSRYDIWRLTPRFSEWMVGVPSRSARLLQLRHEEPQANCCRPNCSGPRKD